METCNLGLQLENIPKWGKYILRGAKYTKCNKLNNKPKTFRGQDCC